MTTRSSLTSRERTALLGDLCVLTSPFLLDLFFLFVLDGFPKYLEIPNCMLRYKDKMRHIKNFKSLSNNRFELSRTGLSVVQIGLAGRRPGKGVQRASVKQREGMV